MFSTIAVGTDGSATASEAVRAAAEIARRFEAGLVLLSAYRESGEAVTDPGEVSRRAANCVRTRSASDTAQEMSTLYDEILTPST